MTILDKGSKITLRHLVSVQENDDLSFEVLLRISAGEEEIKERILSDPKWVSDFLASLITERLLPIHKLRITQGKLFKHFFSIQEDDGWGVKALKDSDVSIRVRPGLNRFDYNVKVTDIFKGDVLFNLGRTFGISSLSVQDTYLDFDNNEPIPIREPSEPRTQGRNYQDLTEIQIIKFKKQLKGNLKELNVDLKGLSEITKRAQTSLKSVMFSPKGPRKELFLKLVDWSEESKENGKLLPWT